MFQKFMGDSSRAIAAYEKIKPLLNGLTAWEIFRVGDMLTSLGYKIGGKAICNTEKLLPETIQDEETLRRLFRIGCTQPATDASHPLDQGQNPDV